jgi:hypothetical protein
MKNTNQNSLTGVAIVLVLIIAIGSWLTGRLPEQEFWYDQTPACTAGSAPVVSGNSLVCP